MPPLTAFPPTEHNLIDINLKGEYENMTKTLNPVKKSSREKKYQCSECGATFDNLQEGKCPDCGIELGGAE